MVARAKYAPNTILRHLREERGWSLQRVADELCRLVEAEDECRLPGVNANMVGVWERGWKRPSPFYQELFCRLYARTASQLGFVHQATIPHAPQSERLPETINPPLVVKHVPQFVLPSEHTQAVDLLCHTAGTTSEQQAAAWLTLGATGLAQLFNEGWTLDDILTSLQLLLSGMQTLPALTRRRLLQVGGTAMISGISLPLEKQITEEEQVHFTRSMGESIGAAWKLFHSTSVQQMLAIAQAQLAILQQMHSLMYPEVRPIFYSAVYNLIGAAVLFQGNYYNALYSCERAYLAALEGADALCMAQSLSWQAHGRKGIDQHAQSIRHIEAALRLLDQQTGEACQKLKALLLADWAVSASWLGETTTAQRKLEASSSLLNKIPLDEEFDCERWYQLAGDCALICKDYPAAIAHFETSLKGLPGHWLIRQAITLIPLAVAYAHIRERDESIRVAEKALRVIEIFNAPVMNKKFLEYMQHDLLETFPHDAKVGSFITNLRETLSQV